MSGFDVFGGWPPYPGQSLGLPQDHFGAMRVGNQTRKTGYVVWGAGDLKTWHRTWKGAEQHAVRLQSQGIPDVHVYDAASGRRIGRSGPDEFGCAEFGDDDELTDHDKKWLKEQWNDGEVIWSGRVIGHGDDFGDSGFGGRKVWYAVNLEAKPMIEEVVWHAKDPYGVSDVYRLRRYGRTVATFKPSEGQEEKIQAGKGRIHIFEDQLTADPDTPRWPFGGFGEATWRPYRMEVDVQGRSQPVVWLRFAPDKLSAIKSLGQVAESEFPGRVRRLRVKQLNAAEFKAMSSGRNEFGGFGGEAFGASTVWREDPDEPGSWTGEKGGNTMYVEPDPDFPGEYMARVHKPRGGQGFRRRLGSLNAAKRWATQETSWRG